MGAYHLNEDGQRLLQGIVFDGFLDAQAVEAQQIHQPAVDLFLNSKTLASLLISVQERVRQVQRQSLRLARSLDARYLGSTFVHVLKSYGIDAAFCALVSGPFANLSEDFNLVVDLIAHENAAAWLEKRKINPCAARALFRQGVVQRIGLLFMRGWSQLIIERFRDAVTNRPTSSETPGFGADSGVDFSGNTRSGGYCGMIVPGNSVLFSTAL